MATVNVPAPRQANISPILNFMLQMSSIREQKETRKLQERQVAVDEAALDISRERLPSQIGQAVGATEQSTALAREANARADMFIKETNETFNAVNTENRRQMAVLSQLGVKEDIAALKVKSARDKEVQAIWDKQPDEIKFNIAHADALGKLATAEIRGLTAQNAAANQTNQMLTLQHRIKVDALNQQMSGLATMESPADRVKAAQAIQSGDAEMFAAAIAGEAAFVEADRATVGEQDTTLKQTTTAIPKLIPREVTEDTVYGDATLATLRTEQAAGRPLPEVRRIRRPASVDLNRLDLLGSPFKKTPFDLFGVGKGADFMMVTENEARQIGALDQWNAAGPTSTDQQSETPVKDNVKSTVKKTAGTKKVTAKSEGKQVTDSRGWIKFVSPDGVDTWVNPKDIELAKSRGYTLGTK